MRFPQSKWFRVSLIIVVLSFSIISLIISMQSPDQISVSLRSNSPIQIDRVQKYLQDQIDMGPRLPGSPASESFRDYITSSISNEWNVEIQNYTYPLDPDVQLRNFWITSANLESGFPKYIIGAHYDSRVRADKDPNFDSDTPQPVPGANDAASGVAGIMELILHLDPSIAPNFGFVLFDAEDQGSGGMPGWPWIYGSTVFVEQMTEEQINATKGFILFDMIADDDLRLPWEGNSDPDLISEIWGQADTLGYGSIFVNEPGPRIIDDHIPFIQAGIPSIDIIDFTYPEHHTMADNMDNVSAESVAIVVDVTLEWIKAKQDLTVFPNTISTTDQVESSSIPVASSSSEANFITSSILISTVVFLSVKSFRRKNGL